MPNARSIDHCGFADGHRGFRIWVKHPYGRRGGSPCSSGCMVLRQRAETPPPVCIVEDFLTHITPIAWCSWVRIPFRPTFGRYLTYGLATVGLSNSNSTRAQ